MTDTSIQMRGGLPYVCPDHPCAKIRHEWNRTRYTVRLTGASWEHDEPNSDQYFCNDCGRELAPTAEQKGEKEEG